MLSEASTRRSAAIVILLAWGDVLVFAFFAIEGRAIHNLPPDALASVAPFAIPWFVVAPLFGVFRSYTARRPAQMLLRTALAWSIAGTIGLVVRAALLQRSIAVTFAIVALGVNGVLLVGWRLVFSLVAARQVGQASTSSQKVARLAIVALAGAALGGAIILAIGPARFFGSLPPLPPPPIITAERGSPPAGIVAFEEQVCGVVLGSGFLLALPNGEVIGVTTAHSLGEGNFYPMIFTPAGHTQPIATFRELYASPGRPRTGADMTIDYVLMRPDSRPDPSYILQPDPRGAPQPGERVSLYSGLGDGSGGQRIVHGTVESVGDDGAWIRMDEVFDPSTMSGSPIISQHTGHVIGMTIVMNWTPGVLRIGINPIGAIVARAVSK